MTKKTKLIYDIQNLLNNYDDINSTVINKNMLDFMDEDTLLNIIGTLLTQKESLAETDLEWLESFKKYKE